MKNSSVQIPYGSLYQLINTIVTRLLYGVLGTYHGMLIFTCRQGPQGGKILLMIPGMKFTNENASKLFSM